MRRSAVSLVFVLLAAHVCFTQGNAQHVHEPHALFISRVHTGTEVLLCQYPSLLACQQDMAQPYDPFDPCAVIELDVCKFVVQAGVYLRFKRATENYVMDAFMDASCSNSVSQFITKDFACGAFRGVCCLV